MLQYHFVVRWMSMLACQSLTAVNAKNCQEYEEGAANMKHTRSLKDLLKKNRGKTVAPTTNYMDLKLNIRTYCGLFGQFWGITAITTRSFKNLPHS